jgi:hypothetical protein
MMPLCSLYSPPSLERPRRFNARARRLAQPRMHLALHFTRCHDSAEWDMPWTWMRTGSDAIAIQQFGGRVPAGRLRTVPSDWAGANGTEGNQTNNKQVMESLACHMRPGWIVCIMALWKRPASPSSDERQLDYYCIWSCLFKHTTKSPSLTIESDVDASLWSTRSRITCRLPVHLRN